MPHQILLVEDDPDARYIYAASMKHARFDVVDVGLACDALESALASRPDVVVLDRRLPDRDGLDLARQWRASRSSMARVPIIVLTAYTTKADAEAAFAAGCDTFLGKPCPGSVLVAHVMKLLITSPPTRRMPKVPARRGT